MKGGGQQTTTQTPSGPASTYLGNVLAKNGQPDYTAVNNATNAANEQQWNQFYNSVIPQLNQRATFLGNPTGAIKDLNSAVTNMTNNQNWNAQQANLNEYNLAQAQGLQAANLDGRTTTERMTPGSGATLADILGGGLGLAGLYNTLFPSSGGSTPGLGNAAISGGKSLYNYLTGAAAPTAGFGAGIAPTALGAPADSLGGQAAAEAGDYFTTGAGAAPAAAAPTADAALGAQVATDAQATSIAPEFAGYSASAGDAGAGLGAGAAGAGGADAGSGAAAGAGLGATAGALAAGGIAAAPIVAGMLTNPVSLTGKYWEGLSGGIQAPAGSQQRQAANQEIISIIATGGTKLPPAIDAYAKANGLYQAAASLNSIHTPMGGMSPTRVKMWQQ